MTEDKNLALDEAAGIFLAGLTTEEREASQREVSRFVRWYGRERPFSGLRAPEVANYAERLSVTDTDYARKLELLKAFLVFAKKKGWTKAGLSAHLKAKKSKNTVATGASLSPKANLTPQGYEDLKAEIAGLKEKRLEIIEEIRRAAADKDFRENAPLAAAREQKGHIDGRIMELEETLKAATVIGKATRTSPKLRIGGKVVLCELASNEEICYQIVDPREVDPLRGRISSASPLGKALMGHSEGEQVEIAVPAGKLRYQIKRVES